MRSDGARVIARKLIKHGVKIIFEFPGGSICPILDELSRHKNIRTVVTRHEQAAIHAADAYARVTGLPGVCMATSGPGASNLVTGIANAYMDSVPLIVITGQVAVWDLKKSRPVRQRGFQELDIVSVVGSITKAAFRVRSLTDLAGVLDKAFFIACEGRPGPVLVDVPINVQYTMAGYKETDLALREKKPACSGSALNEIAERFLRSRRPLVLSGGGVVLSSAEDELLKILKANSLAVVQTLMGINGVPSDYELNLGLIGYAGSRAGELAVKSADFILGLGLRFDNRAFPAAKKEFAGNAYIVHVDCDRAELNHRVAADKAVLSDVRLFLRDFNSALKGRRLRIDEDWLEQVREWKSEVHNAALARSPELTPRFILGGLSSLLAAQNRCAVITTDVGQHQLWTAQYFRFDRDRILVTSGGLGTMGFGLPAAIGAKFGRPKAEAINITSDGSFQMNIQELATIKDNRLPVKIILLNNKCLGLVRQIQEFAFCARYESTRMNSGVDFVKIASGYGIKAFSCKKSGDVLPLLKKLIASKESMLVDFRINEFENVYPVRVKGKTVYAKRPA